MTHPVIIAARLLVRDMGGAAEAARHLGKSGSTLAHELEQSHAAGSSNAALEPSALKARPKLGLLDAVTLMQASADTRLISAIAAECGGVYMPLPQMADGAGQQDTVNHVTRLVGEFGDVLREVAARTPDGEVSDNDMTVLQAESLELMGALQALMVHLARLNQAGKPPAPRLRVA